MNRIQVLSSTLADQITAGEVIESPASVVKELIENSIDANSKKINVDIYDGGLKNITVIDDGDGIILEDLPLAFQTHATSKLSNKKELFKIKTLGFRGEALAAISSISKVTLTSTAKGSKKGGMICVSEGDIVEEGLASARQGTKIEVEDLFFATPDRYKYAKDLQKEKSKVVDLMNRFALSYPNINFQLRIDNKEYIKTFANNNELKLLSQIYGTSVAKKMISFEKENLDFKVHGYISLPEETRSSKKNITIILNGRYIKNNNLYKTIIEGYGSKLMTNRYPYALVKVDFDPSLVDVNVHPTKREVRLSKEDELLDLLRDAIDSALNDQIRIPNGINENLKRRINQRTEQISLDFSHELPTKVQDQEEVYKAEKKVLEQVKNIDHWANNPVFDNPFDEQKYSIGKLDDDSDIYHDSHNSVVKPMDTNFENSSNEEIKEESINKFPHLEYFGQMHGTYLFAQNEEGLYIIDQHAAQERIKYEDYRVKIGQVSNDQQQLLTSIVLNFTNDDAIKIKDNLDKLKDFGIELEEFGNNSFVMHTHPTWITDSIEDTVKEIIDLYLQDPNLTISKYREDIAIMMSCKHSIKANHHLSDSQARQLIIDLSKCENPYNCPHGRPVLVKMTNYDLEKMFKRIQDQ